MDINAIPKNHGMDTDTWARLIREQGVCFYDGTMGNPPTFMNIEESIKVFDVEDEEAMRELERIMADDSYDPELPPAPLITPIPEEESEGLTFTDGAGQITWNDTTTNLTIEGIGGAIDGGSLIRMEEMFYGDEENIEQVVSPFTDPEILDNRYPHLAERLRAEHPHPASSNIVPPRGRAQRQTEPGFELTDDTE